MKLSKTKLASVIVLAVAIISLVFLVQDIYNLQKRCEQFTPPDYPIPRVEYKRLIGMLNELQAMINLRVATAVLVLTATVIALLVLNKRKIFKGKYAVVATALILLSVSFFEVPIVNADGPATATVGYYYDEVELAIPQNHSSDLASVTGYITTRPADVSEYFTSYYIDVVSHTSQWNDWLQAGISTEVGKGTFFYIESVVEDKQTTTTAPNVSFFETYLIQIKMVIVEGKILWSAYIYDSIGNEVLKTENVFLRYADHLCTAGGESTSDHNGMEAEFSELKWSCFFGDSGYWDGTEGFTCTTYEDDPYFLKMITSYYHFLVSTKFGIKTLTISVPYDHGTTYPAPEYHTYNYGTSVTVNAIADSGYGFDYWILDEEEMYVQNPITITMNQPYTLEAHFKSTSGGGGCPTLFVWNGTAYVEEGALDIHAESDVTVQHRIENTLALKNGVYKLQLRELDNHTSHIDQVKLYAVDYKGEWHLCQLTYAYHSELGEVKHTLRFDDDSRVDLKPTEILNLKFALSIPYDKTAYFIFEINGYNPKNGWYPK